MIFTTETRSNSTLFGVLTKELLAANLGVRFQAHGRSMAPAIADEEIVYVQPAAPETLACGDVVLFSCGEHFRAHRVIKTGRCSRLFVTQGDSTMQADAAVFPQQIMGKVVAVEDVASGRLRSVAQPARRSIGARAFRAAQRLGRRAFAFCGVLSLLFLMLSLNAAAQVVADTTDNSSNKTELTSNGSTLTFAHTVPNTLSNMYLLVGVSMNIENNPGATVSKVSYGGTTMTLVGVHNDSTNMMRVELWGLVNPKTGANNVIVNANLTAAGVTVGVVANAMDFSGVNQTTPLLTQAGGSSYAVSDDGGSPDPASSLTVAGSTTALSVDFLAAQGATADITTITPGTGETTLWNADSGTTYTKDVVGFGGSWQGAASVTMSESFAQSSYWSQIGVSIQPVAAYVPPAPIADTGDDSNGKAELSTTTTGGTATLTFTHTVLATLANQYLLVGVSLNTNNSPSASTAVQTVTWNGNALTKLGVEADSNTQERVELWYMLNPPSANGANVVVTVAINTASVNVGVVAGAANFSGVNQTTPLLSGQTDGYYKVAADAGTAGTTRRLR